MGGSVEENKFPRYLTWLFFAVALLLSSISAFHMIEILRLKNTVNLLEQRLDHLSSSKLQLSEEEHSIQKRQIISTDAPQTSTVQNGGVPVNDVIKQVETYLQTRCAATPSLCAGQKGDMGPQGVKGGKGDIGLPGVSGSKGDAGMMGPPGLKGDIGPFGPVGPQGSKGEKGQPGATGSPGPQGPKGEAGQKGENGVAGPKGEFGLQGPQGLQGNSGPKGEKGAQGESGPFGPSGIKGQPGEKGAPGPKGVAGIQGLTGVPGTKGERGDAGVPGQKGDTGVMGPPGPTGIQGQMGPQGPMGEKGAPGATGLRGEKGSTGMTGLNGLDGLDGQKGEPGLQGPIGPVGSKGENGAQGNQGLPGPKGLQGIPGVTGQKGEPGEDGPFGPMGSKGETGSPGIKGDMGFTGQKGESGQVGFPGSKGEPGVRGPPGEKGDKGDTGLSSNCCNLLSEPTIQGADTYVVKARVGATVLLPCVTSSGYPPPRVSWVKETGNGNVVPSGTPTTSGLMLVNVNVTQSGKYICRASNALGAQEKIITLQIEDDRPKITSQHHVIGVSIGDSVNNLCTVTNTNQVTLTYNKASGLMPTHNILPAGNLIFYFRSPSETGEYRCQAITEKGTVATTFFVYEKLNLTCSTLFSDCATIDMALCGGECPANCPNLDENYHAHKFSLNLPVCRAAVNSYTIPNSGGHVVWKNEKLGGGEAAEFITLVDN